MKNQIKISALAIGMMVAANVQAQEKTAPVVMETPTFFAKFEFKQDSPSVKLLMNKREGNDATMSVSLKDANGHYIYTTKVSKSEKGRALNFDLAQLTDGAYTFEFENKNGKTSKTFLKETTPAVVKLNQTLVAIK